MFNYKTFSLNRCWMICQYESIRSELLWFLVWLIEFVRHYPFNLSLISIYKMLWPFSFISEHGCCQTRQDHFRYMICTDVKVYRSQLNTHQTFVSMYFCFAPSTMLSHVIAQWEIIDFFIHSIHHVFHSG